MLKIYGVPVSVHTRKVIVVALAKGLAYENVPVVPVIPGNPPADWRNLSPTGKIPALTDGDFTVADSAAICAYLERVQPAPAVYPAAARDFATALAFEQHASQLFRDVVHPLFHETFVHPRIHKVPSNTQRIDDVLNRVLPESFGHFEVAISGNWLAGSAVSVADYALASNLVTYSYLGFGIDAARFPRLSAHFDRVVRDGAMREALRREQQVVDSMSLDRSWHVQDR